MQALANTPLLKHNPDTLEVVRKELNLHQPGRMDESIDRLDEWVKAQPHFNKKRFSRQYLEYFIISAKGSVESAKVYIEKLCAYKTFGPQYFSYSVKPIDLPELDDIDFCVLPRLTKDNLRIILLRNMVQKEYTQKVILNYLIKTHFMSEYMLINNCSFGVRVILDYRKTDLSHIVAAVKYPEARHGFNPFFKGYITRVKSIHIISTSKLVGLLVTTLGQVISPKMLGRVYVHAKLEDVYEHIEKDLLPSDYGGNEKPFKEICDEWDRTLSTDESMEYFKEMFQATIDPKLKPLDNFTDLCLGIQGTFRMLSID